MNIRLPCAPTVVLGTAMSCAAVFAQYEPQPFVGGDAREVWALTEGTTTVVFDYGVGARELGADGKLSHTARSGPSRADAPVRSIRLPIEPGAEIAVGAGAGGLAVVDGVITHSAGLTLVGPEGERSLYDLALWPDGATGALHAIDGRGQHSAGLLLGPPELRIDFPSRTVLMTTDEVTLTPGLATALGLPELMNGRIGSVRIEASFEPIGRQDVTAGVTYPVVASAAGSVAGEGAIGPDVILWTVNAPRSWAVVHDPASERVYTAVSVATASCNVGDEPAIWVRETNEHPVIAQNVFRLRNDRFEQIGMSWVKHGFFAVNDDRCGTCTGRCVAGEPCQLYPQCGDPYSATLNGDQSNLGPRSFINAFTGEFDCCPRCTGCSYSAPPHPRCFMSNDEFEGCHYRRIRLDHRDLDPGLNAGAHYFVEGQYVTPDEPAFDNQHNNNSYSPAGLILDGQAGCVVQGQCFDTTLKECDSLGGRFQRLGTSCAEFRCNLLTGVACCFPDGSCVNQAPKACMLQGGRPNEQGHSCSAVDCDLEACCFSDDTCETLSASDCTAQGGTPQGRGSSCDGITCGSTTGACCMTGYCFAIGTGVTRRQQPAVMAWKEYDDSVLISEARVPDTGTGQEGLVVLGARTSEVGTGVWRYEYALQNLTSDRSIGSFSVPLPTGAVLTNVGFHDVDHHSGEPYDTTEWPHVIDGMSITWATTPYDENPDANALRWGTLYNFRFDANVGPESTTVNLGLFKPGDPDSFGITTVGPAAGFVDCNGNGRTDACDIECLTGCKEPCGTSDDCNGNSIPDECEADCNENGIADECDIRDGTSDDCDGNGVPDKCDPDCDGDGIIDACETVFDTDSDCVLDCDDLCPTSTPAGSCCCEECCCFGTGICVCGVYTTDECLSFDPPGEPTCLDQPCRDGCIVGDWDGDGDLDLFDGFGFQFCYSGKDTTAAFVTPSEDCLRRFDFEGDGDIDLDDWNRLFAVYQGPGGG